MCIASAAASVLILALLLVSIAWNGFEHLNVRFLSNFPSGNAAEAGFKAALWGSVWLCVVSASAALPIGVAAAVFLEELRPRARLTTALHTLIQLNIRNLAGVPSIVYGIIGLTVFVRCFGLFGNPNQYDRLTSVTLDDGRVVEGFLAEERSDTLVVDVTGVEGAQRAEGVDWPVALEVPISIIKGAQPDTRRAPIGSPISISVLRDSALPLELGFALVPVEEAASPPTLTIHAVLRQRREGALSLDRLPEGRIDLEPVHVAVRRDFTARGHVVTLTSGERLRVDSITLAGASATLRIAGSPRTMPAADIASFEPLRPLTVGSESSLAYLRLPLGGSVLAGGLTLALVILPIVIIATQEALRAVPPSLREAAFAAGATRWQAVSRVVLPAAMPGIMTGAILAMSRAIGEAAPLLVVGGFLFITFTPANLMSDFAAMPLQIYQWASRPESEFHSVAASGIIVLLAVLLLFNAAAILLRQKFQKSLS